MGHRERLLGRDARHRTARNDSPGFDRVFAPYVIGFSVWKRRSGNGHTVTFPARQYAAAGARRTFALLRPISDAGVPTRIRDLVLKAYAEYEQEAVNASNA